MSVTVRKSSHQNPSAGSAGQDASACPSPNSKSSTDPADDVLTVSAGEVYDAVVAAITEHQDSIYPFAATLPEFEVRLVAGMTIGRLRGLSRRQSETKQTAA